MSLREELVKYVPYNEQEENDKKVMIDFIDSFDNYLVWSFYSIFLDC